MDEGPAEESQNTHPYKTGVGHPTKDGGEKVKSRSVEAAGCAVPGNRGAGGHVQE